MKYLPPMNCRYCGKALAAQQANPYHPFCSKTCKMADLGKWFSGDYQICEPLQLEENEFFTETDPPLE